MSGSFIVRRYAAEWSRACGALGHCWRSSGGALPVRSSWRQSRAASSLPHESHVHQTVWDTYDAQLIAFHNRHSSLFRRCERDLARACEPEEDQYNGAPSTSDVPLSDTYTLSCDVGPDGNSYLSRVHRESGDRSVIVPDTGGNTELVQLSLSACGRWAAAVLSGGGSCGAPEHRLALLHNGESQRGSFAPVALPDITVHTAEIIASGQDSLLVLLEPTLDGRPFRVHVASLAPCGTVGDFRVVLEEHRRGSFLSLTPAADRKSAFIVSATRSQSAVWTIDGAREDVCTLIWEEKDGVLAVADALDDHVYITHNNSTAGNFQVDRFQKQQLAHTPAQYIQAESVIPESPCDVVVETVLRRCGVLSVTAWEGQCGVAVAALAPNGALGAVWRRRAVAPHLATATKITGAAETLNDPRIAAEVESVTVPPVETALRITPPSSQEGAWSARTPAAEGRNPSETLQQETIVRRDGGELPISLIRKPSARANGRALVLVYGSYGLPTPMRFDPVVAALALRGWTIAVVHARGSCDRGGTWRKAGWKRAARTRVDDVLDAARWCISQGLVERGTVDLLCASAGAIAGANAVLFDPAIFGSAVLRSPLVHIGGYTRDIDVLDADEWGSWFSPEDARSIQSLSPLANLKAMSYVFHCTAEQAARLPTMYVSAAMDDDRVDVYEVEKFCAIAAKLSKGTTLFQVFESGGHFARDYVSEMAVLTRGRLA